MGITRDAVAQTGDRVSLRRPTTPTDADVAVYEVAAFPPIRVRLAEPLASAWRSVIGGAIAMAEVDARLRGFVHRRRCVMVGYRNHAWSVVAHGSAAAAVVEAALAAAMDAAQSVMDAAQSVMVAALLVTIPDASTSADEDASGGILGSQTGVL